jgi:hypothetical protein
MSDAARVTSIDALKDFRESVQAFLEEAKNALIAVELENRRAIDWLVNRQRLYWAEELKRRREKHSMALTELHRKKLQQRPGTTVFDTDQQEAVRATLVKVREAEAKIELVKKWTSPLQHAIDEYHGVARPLGDMLEGDVRHSINMLERMIISLEEYLRMSPPT